MKIMKKLSLAALLTFAAMFSTNSQADLTQYTETDSDNSGDSFNITFQWDTVNKTITQVMSGSFIDAGGLYQNVTELDASIATTNGTINALISDANFNGITLYLTAGAVPSPSMVDIGLYAVTSSSNPGNIATFYSNPPTLVPEPAEWVMLLLGLPLVSWVVRKNSAKQMWIQILRGCLLCFQLRLFVWVIC